MYDLESFVKPLGLDYTASNAPNRILLNNGVKLCALDLIPKVDNKYYVWSQYHLDVSIGFKPIFVYWDEIRDKSHIISSILLHKLGRTPNKVHARECKIEHDISPEWLDHNHMRGCGRTQQGTMLIHDNRIVAAMSVRWHNRKNRCLEIERYCNLCNTAVVGGYTKLLQAIRRTYEPKSLVASVDLRFTSVKNIARLGFSLISHKPSPYWTDGKIRTTKRDDTLHKCWDVGKGRFSKILIS